ncbi:MAG: DUF2949 domain-containing protein [Synechococcales cyanobacterium T60_A2020_003]|nr:DUF2949 domain-containing protein [Synechococcales cyanobacterium T60_A2020_003]
MLFNQSSLIARLIHFLRDDLCISDDSIQMALRHEGHTPNLLPMVLWQYGLVTLEQLDRIFDWLEANPQDSSAKS